MSPKTSCKRIKSNDRRHLRVQVQYAEPQSWLNGKLLKSSKYVFAVLFFCERFFQITINYLQVIAVGISVNVDWTESLIGIFEAAGATQNHLYLSVLFSRVCWGCDV